MSSSSSVQITGAKIWESVSSGHNWKWQFLVEPENIEKIKTSKVLQKIDSKDEAWYISIRRLKRWFRTKDCDQKRIWGIVIARPKARRLMLTTIFNSASTFKAGEYQEKRFSPETMATLLNITMEHYGKRPSEIMILCGPGGSYRPMSADKLIKGLQPHVLPIKIVRQGCDEIPHSNPSSVTAMYPPQNALSTQNALSVAPECDALINYITQTFYDRKNESSENDGSSVPVGPNFFSLHTKCLSYCNPTISVALLYNFYSAAKDYHMEKVWLTFSNNELVRVTLKNGASIIVMVAGHTDYAGRGAYFFYNLEDVRKLQISGETMKRYVHKRDSLQFVSRDRVPFQYHDHVAELDLPLATNDVHHEVHPVLFGGNNPFSFPGGYDDPQFVYHLINRWNKKPNLQGVSDLTDVLRAVTQLTQTPMLAYRAPGFSGLRYANGPVALDVDGPNPFQCVIEIVVIQAGKDDAIKLDLHDKNKCNFCNVPRTESQKLMGCARCKYVYYCGSRCQTRDYKRHKKECKEMALKMSLEEEEKKMKKKMKKKKKKKKKKKDDTVVEEEVEKEKANNLVVRVRLIGLKSENLNGKEGIREKWDEEAGRYVVALDGEDGKRVKVKLCNLENL